MQRSDNTFWFRYPVYNPCISVLDVVDDWGRGFMQGTDDLDWVLAQPFRVAALPVFYDRPTSWSYHPQLADLDLTQFDLVLFSDPEYHDLDQVRDWIKIQHCVLATGGIYSDRDMDVSNEIYRPYYIRDFIEQNVYHDTGAKHKPFKFDALLGARRPHRDFVWKALHRSNLLQDTVTTYRAGFPGEIKDDLTEMISSRLGQFMQWPYVSPNLDPAWEVSNSVTNRDSRQSPLEIYSRTWYSIICETQYTGDSFFLSEKTIKAMFNRRIFVMFGPAGYLSGLENHGFKTFQGWIDETYDRETHDLRRYEQAMQQVWRLAWLENPVELYEAMCEILDQNQKRLYELEQLRCRSMCDMLIAKIPSRYWHWPPVQIP